MSRYLPPAFDAAQWRRLSPLLDELMDLDSGGREARLAELAAPPVALSAADVQWLRDWLAKDASLEAQQFLQRDAPQQVAVAESLPTWVDLSGQVIGPYTLLGELGRGGMGAVWLAQRSDGRFEGQVAIKFLQCGMLSRGALARFQREGQILARLNHPHIARLLDAGVHDLPQGPQPYLVLEYVEGQPIDQYCREHLLDAPARVRLLLDVLDAVAHAQQHLILHRDIKPGNILVTAQGVAKLLDFGVAKLLDRTEPLADATNLTRVAGAAFTPRYAAPEQIQQQAVTTATDVYALGVLLFTLLSGSHPTQNHSGGELDQLRALVETAPRRLSEAAAESGEPPVAREARLLRGDLDTIAAKALKKDPADRYANAAALADDLRRWLRHQPISARPERPLYVLRCFIRRHRLAVAASATALAGLVGLTGLSVWQAHRAATAEQLAQARRQQADDLLAFLLGDFADKLRPIGRLELLDSVGGKALTHLAATGQLTPQERLQRAKALTVIGEVRVSKRDLDAAVEPLQQADALLKDEPSSSDLIPAWRKAQGAAAFWLGHIAYTQRRFAAAEPELRRYRQVCQQWLDARPDDSDAQVELSYATNSLGSLWLIQGRLREAEQAFRQSLGLKTEAFTRRPNDTTLQAEWSDSLSWLGTTLVQMGRYVEGQSLLMRALQQAAQLRAHYPTDLAWQEKQGNAALALAEALGRDGQAEAAAQHYADAVLVFRSLSTANPNNRQTAFNLIRAEAGVQRRQPRAETVAALQARLSALEAGRPPLVRLHPLRAELAQLRAQALRRDGQATAAAAQLVDALALLKADVDRHPHDLNLREAYLELALLETFAMPVPDRRQARCETLWTEQKQSSLADFLRVHAGLTRVAMRLQDCRGQRLEALALQAWLDEQRSVIPAAGSGWADSPVPTGS